MVSAIENCFSTNPPYLHKVYNIPDVSGNYSVGTEYWMRLDAACDFTIDADTKMTWYSSDITVNYQLSFDNGDGSSCRAPDPRMESYKSGTPFEIGSNATDGACLVKYQINNANTHHDLRIQLFSNSYQYDTPSGALQLTLASTVGVLSAALFLVL